MASGGLQLAVDGVLLVLLLALLWRLRRDPSQIWIERERALRKVCESLARLVAQAQASARDLDRDLAERMGQIGALLEALPSGIGNQAKVAPVALAADRRATDLDLLLARGLGLEEAARRLGVPVAEARVAARIGQWRKRGGGA